eukprot:3104299-Prymnesium_polylepis.1
MATTRPSSTNPSRRSAPRLHRRSAMAYAAARCANPPAPSRSLSFVRPGTRAAEVFRATDPPAARLSPCRRVAGSDARFGAAGAAGDDDHRHHRVEAARVPQGAAVDA